nr:hypothetical protein [uncultured Duncaniella sp.]
MKAFSLIIVVVAGIVNSPSKLNGTKYKFVIFLLQMLPFSDMYESSAGYLITIPLLNGAVIEEGYADFFKLLQPLNASEPIVVTKLGMTTLVKALQS